MVGFCVSKWILFNSFHDITFIIIADDWVVVDIFKSRTLYFYCKWSVDWRDQGI